MSPERKRAEELQDVVNAVAEAAVSEPDLTELCRRIHALIGTLLPARNFYIAIYDQVADSVTFPYWVDQYDVMAGRGGRPLGRGVTDWVLRTGRPLLADLASLRALERRGELEVLGAPCLDWLGVPLRIGEEVIGVLALQSYDERERYSRQDLELLVFVSRQVAMAIRHGRGEEALRESTRRLDTLVNNLPGVAFRCGSDPSRTMEYLSAGILELTGYTAAALLRNGERTYTSLIVEEDLQRVGDSVQAAISARREYTVEYRLRTVTGSERWVWERGRGVFDGQRLDAIEGFLVDVTDRVRAEAERVALESRLRQAEKMESVGRLAGGVAHDLNNLLVPILGFSDILIDGFAPGAAEREMVDHIRTAANRARDLTHRLLAFSRKQVLELKTIDLVGVVAGFLRLVSRTIREDIAIEAKVPSDAVWARADVGQIEQVLMNLVLNAQDAMPGGGRLTVAVAEVQGPPRAAVISVRDSGTGMAAEAMAHLFEPFFTTKGPGEGTGLGLSTAYGIVKQHGGELEAITAPGQGTELRVVLPVAPTPPEEGTAPALRETASAGGSETILLVEDDSSVREMAAVILKRFGYHVVAAPDGQSALARLHDRSLAIDVLLTDVVMPGMNGRELAELARCERPGLGVLFMSGYTDDVIGRHGVLESGVRLLSKPFTPQALAAAVRSALDGK